MRSESCLFFLFLFFFNEEGLRLRIIALTFFRSRNEERPYAVALTYNECMLKMESNAVAPVTVPQASQTMQHHNG